MVKNLFKEIMIEMNTNFTEIDTEVKQIKNMEIVTLKGETYYKIANHDTMRPFFMSIVSDANHWMFIYQ